MYSVPDIAKKRKLPRKGMRPIQSNLNIEAQYYKNLKYIVTEIRKKFTNLAIEEMAKPTIKNQWQDAAPYNKALDKVIDKIIAQIRKRFHNERLEKVVRKILLSADKYQGYKFRKAVEYGFGFSIEDLPEFKAYKPFINATISKNLEVLSDLRDNTLYRMSMALRTTVAQGKSIRQVQSEIMRTGEITKKRAALIARNEIKNITSALNKKRSINAGFSTYIWLTAEDERVRGNPRGRYPSAKPSHYIMDGLLCKYEDDTVYSKDGGKTWKKRTVDMPIGFPGTVAINCRCVDTPQD